MNKRELVWVVTACVMAVFCLLAPWGRGQQPPQKFPLPVDGSIVRMHFAAGRMVVYAPSDRVTTRPGMDKTTTIIEIDTAPPNP